MIPTTSGTHVPIDTTAPIVAGAHGWKNLWSIMEHTNPALLHRFYPRIYDNLGKWYSPRIPACLLAYISLQVLDAYRKGTHMHDAHPAMQNQGLIALQCHQHAVPTFFVSTAFLRAIEHTNPPEDFPWAEMPMPHPGMLFMFEQGALQHPSDGPISFIAVGRTRVGTLKPNLHPSLDLNIREGGLMVMSGAHETENYVTYDLSMSEVTSPTIRHIRELGERERSDDPLRYDIPLTPDDKKWNAFMTVLAIKLILAMNIRPEFISKGVLLREVKAKRPGDHPKKFWSPNIIGRNYVAPSSGVPNGDAEGSGGHKRMHWRRGHFTQQPYGEGRALRKTLWIEPMIIGGAKQ